MTRFTIPVGTTVERFTQWGTVGRLRKGGSSQLIVSTKRAVYTEEDFTNDPYSDPDCLHFYLPKGCGFTFICVGIDDLIIEEI
jgi:hypothetical protein